MYFMRNHQLLKMENERNDDGYVEDGFFGSLPEGFVAKALSLTSPKDACRLSLVCSLFRSAAEWDAVWGAFLPEDYRKILTPVEHAGYCCLTKKELFLRLCDRPLIIDGGLKSFSLDKQTGKKCYMLAARDLSIVWGDTPRYWRWISFPESRFKEVAELVSVCWFEIHGKIKTTMLSPNTIYTAFMVFKWTSETHGFGYQPTEVSIGLNGPLEAHQTQTVFLEPQGDQPRRHYPVVPRRRMGMFSRGRILNPTLVVPFNTCSNGNGPKPREDGWMEIELGDYFAKNGEDGELEMSITEVKSGNWKGGIIIQGIEIRPKHCNDTS